jgi:hypothetical protein
MGLLLLNFFIRAIEEIGASNVLQVVADNPQTVKPREKNTKGI